MEDATTTVTLEDGLQAEQTLSEDEDELTQKGHGLKDFWERDEGKESWDEREYEHEDEAAAAVDDDDDEDEDEDDLSDIMHGSSFHFGLLSFFLVLSAISFHFYLNVWA